MLPGLWVWMQVLAESWPCVGMRPVHETLPPPPAPSPAARLQWWPWSGERAHLGAELQLATATQAWCTWQSVLGGLLFQDGVKDSLENLLRKSVFHVICSHILLPGFPGLQLHLLFPRKDFLFWCSSQCVCCGGRISAFRKAAVCLPFSGWDCKAVCQNALVETRVVLHLPIFQKAFRKELILSSILHGK